VSSANFDLSTDFIEGIGGVRLAVHTMGDPRARPVLLLHGLFSSADINWIRYGHAAKLAAQGRFVIMPDMRAHGQSEASQDPAAYPMGVLVDDALAIVRALGLSAFDLGGFSLGSRTSVRGVLAGLLPERLILGGMGLEGLAGWMKRSAFFIDAIDRFGTIRPGDPAYIAQQFMKQMNIDRQAARLLLQSIDDTPPEALAALTMPTLVVCGDKDNDNGSATRLVEALPTARYAEIPGTHMGSVTQAELGDAMVAFLEE